MAAPSPNGFRPIELGSQVVIKGGFAKDVEFVVETKELAGPDDLPVRFVKVTKQSWWLIKMTGGTSLQRGGLTHTTLLEDLRQRIIRLTAGIDSPDKSTTAAVAATTETSDPTDMMNVVALLSTDSSQRPSEKPNAPVNLGTRGKQRRKRLASKVMVAPTPGEVALVGGRGRDETEKGVGALGERKLVVGVGE